MSIAAVCFATCFIAINYDPIEYQKISSMQNIMKEDIEVRVHGLEVLKITTRLNFERDLQIMLERAVVYKVNPTLRMIERNITAGPYDKGAMNCYDNVKKEVLNLARQYFNETMIPCINAFETFTDDSLDAVPNFIKELKDIRTRMTEMFEICDRHVVVQDPVECVQEKHAKIKNETLSLLGTVQTFTDNYSPSLYSLARERFVKCMMRAGSELETAARNVTNVGTKCIIS